MTAYNGGNLNLNEKRLSNDNELQNETNGIDKLENEGNN